jgi:hypothetical protein
MNQHLDRSRTPSALRFYEQEIGKLSRPSRGWAMGRCPFHKSKSGRSFSVNTDSGGFKCFGCAVRGGDVISFARLRYNLGFKEACQRLGCWNEAPSPATIRKIEEDERDRKLQQQAEEQAAEDRRKSCLEIRGHLHAAQQIQRELGAEGDEELNRLLENYIRKLDAQYCEAAGLEPL